MKKITKTFSIDDKVYQKFEEICGQKKLNKSVILQDAILNFISENYDIKVGAKYKLKGERDESYVKVTGTAKAFKTEQLVILLDNDNVINLIDFIQLYEKVDIIDSDILDKPYQGLIRDLEKIRNQDDILLPEDEKLPNSLEELIVQLNELHNIKPNSYEEAFELVPKESAVIEIETDEEGVNTSCTGPIIEYEKMWTRKKHERKNLENKIFGEGENLTGPNI